MRVMCRLRHRDAHLARWTLSLKNSSGFLASARAALHSIIIHRVRANIVKPESLPAVSDAAAVSVFCSFCSCDWRKFRAAAGRSQRALLVELGARPASPDAGRCARAARGRERETSDGMIEKVLLSDRETLFLFRFYTVNTSPFPPHKEKNMFL